ncbi:MAG TPA: hypothetical protein VF122_02430 [Caulobacteraceae bacterium]
MTRIYHARKALLMAAAVTLAAAGTAQAQSGDGGRAAALQALVDCRAMADDAARLACYDSAAAGLEEAEAKGDVVVLDRAQAQQARREAFGFSIPTFDLFKRGEPTEKLDRATFTIARAWEATNDGQWSFELDSGAIWRQTDHEHLSRRPRPGMTVEVRSAAMGSYFMNVDGQRAIRVTRVQ